MKFAEWLAGVPAEITNDPAWKLEVYRLALFAGDLGWLDVQAISKRQHMLSIADQLQRAVQSISANITEGYSRSKPLDRARFLEYTLGSARESRDWYYKARWVLPEDVIRHRMNLLTQLIAMLVSLIPQQRRLALREEQADYQTLSQETVPLP